MEKGENVSKISKLKLTIFRPCTTWEAAEMRFIQISFATADKQVQVKLGRNMFEIGMKYVWNWKEMFLKLGRNMFEIGKKICLKLGRNVFEIGKKCVWNVEEICSDLRRASATTIPYFQIPPHCCWGGNNTPGFSSSSPSSCHHFCETFVCIQFLLINIFSFQFVALKNEDPQNQLCIKFKTLMTPSKIGRMQVPRNNNIRLGIRRKYLCRFQEIIYDLQFNRRKYSCRFQKIILDLERILIWENIL